ncbi:MAG: PAS domain S-box protein [Desulfobacterales bacterium]|nr:PAS domain S-box protein [Desulfobacterales bacterium]
MDANGEYLKNAIIELKHENLLLKQLSIALSSCRDLKQALDSILEIACKIDEIDCGAVYTLNHIKNTIELFHHRGLSPEFIEAIKHYDTNAPQTMLVKQGKPIYHSFSEIEFENGSVKKKEGLKSLAIIPINIDDKVIAVLNLASHTKDKISEGSKSIIETLSVNVGGVIAKAKFEHTLIENEKRYQSIVDTIEEGYYELNKSGNIVFGNESLCKIVGYSKKELIGLNITHLIPPKKLKKFYKNFKRCFELGKLPEDITLEILKKNKSKRNIEASLSFISDHQGNNIGIRGIIKDITTKAKILAKLIDTKKFLQNVINSSGDGIITTDLTGTINFASPMARQLLGLSPSEIVGEKIYFFYGNKKADAIAIMKKLRENKEFIEHEVQMLRKDGTVLDINISASFLKNEASEIIGTLGIFRDITEKKRLISQLHHSQKMETIGIMAGGVAHDLNNIISGIVGYPDLILRQLPEDSALRKPLTSIQKSGEKAAALIEDLLTLARRKSPVKINLNLNEIITEYINSPEGQKLTETYPDITLEIDLEEDLLDVYGSKIHLYKTIMNIVMNAFESISNKGKVSIKTNNIFLNKAVSVYSLEPIKEGYYVKLTISDSGVGISSKDIQRIFEPFYTKKVMKKSGSGLGLSVVWGTIEDHMGYIDVKSSLSEGTAFILYIPVFKEI